MSIIYYKVLKFIHRHQRNTQPWTPSMRYLRIRFWKWYSKLLEFLGICSFIFTFWGKYMINTGLWASLRYLTTKDAYSLLFQTGVLWKKPVHTSVRNTFDVFDDMAQRIVWGMLYDRPDSVVPDHLGWDEPKSEWFVFMQIKHSLLLKSMCTVFALLCVPNVQHANYNAHIPQVQAVQMIYSFDHHA